MHGKTVGWSPAPTSGDMEVVAAIRALSYVDEPSVLTVHSDYQNLVERMTKDPGQDSSRVTRVSERGALASPLTARQCAPMPPRTAAGVQKKPTQPEQPPAQPQAVQKLPEPERRKPKSVAKQKRQPGRLPGRPTVITPDVVKLLVAGRRAGLPEDQVAENAGITPRVYYMWKAKGLADDAAGVDSQYVQLFQELGKARAEWVSKQHGIIEDAADGTSDESGKTVWQAAAWLLERRVDGYAKQVPQTTVNTGPVTNNNLTVVGGYTDEEARIAAKAIVRARRLAQEAELQIEAPAGNGKPQ